MKNCCLLKKMWILCIAAPLMILGSCATDSAEPVLEPGTRAVTGVTLTPPANVTGYMIGVEYRFIARVAHDISTSPLPDPGSSIPGSSIAGVPSVTVSGGAHSITQSGSVAKIIFKEGAMYTVTASYTSGGQTYTASLQVNTHIYARVREDYKSTFAGTSGYTNTLEFYTAGGSKISNLSIPINVMVYINIINAYPEPSFYYVINGPLLAPAKLYEFNQGGDELDGNGEFFLENYYTYVVSGNHWNIVTASVSEMWID